MDSLIVEIEELFELENQLLECTIESHIKFEDLKKTFELEFKEHYEILDSSFEEILNVIENESNEDSDLYNKYIKVKEELEKYKLILLKLSKLSKPIIDKENLDKLVRHQNLIKDKVKSMSEIFKNTEKLI